MQLAIYDKQCTVSEQLFGPPMRLTFREASLPFLSSSGQVLTKLDFENFSVIAHMNAHSINAYSMTVANAI